MAGYLVAIVLSWIGVLAFVSLADWLQELYEFHVLCKRDQEAFAELQRRKQELS